MLFTGFFNSAWMIAYGVLGALISGIYLILDFWLIMTPDAMDYDDFILGSMLIYLDIMRLLMYILIIFGSSK